MTNANELPMPLTIDFNLKDGTHVGLVLLGKGAVQCFVNGVEVDFFDFMAITGINEFRVSTAARDNGGFRPKEEPKGKIDFLEGVTTLLSFNVDAQPTKFGETSMQLTGKPVGSVSDGVTHDRPVYDTKFSQPTEPFPK